MKRGNPSGDADQPIPKQRKISQFEVDCVFGSSGPQRFISNVLRNGAGVGSDAGYIRGTVFMTWGQTEKETRILINTLESELGDNLVRVEVLFKGRCAATLKERHVKFETQDDVMIALRGANVLQRKGSSGAVGTLEYRKGTTIKFLGRNSGSSSVVDTWMHAFDNENSPEEDWFDPPSIVQHGSKDAQLETSATPEMLENRENPHSTLPLVTDHRSGSSPSAVIHPEEGPAQNESNRTPEVVDTSTKNKMSKKERKALRTAKHHREREAQARASHETVATNLASDTSVAGPSSEGNSSVPSKAESSPSTSTSPEQAKTTVTEEPEAKGPLDLKPGRRFRNGIYTALAEANKTKTLYNFAAVVVSASEPRHANGNDNALFVSLGLVDPSNRMLTDNSYLGTHSIGVKCFTAKHESWLPRPNVGDVILLQNVKGRLRYDEVRFVGYNDQLKWAIYNPETNSVHHGDIPQDVPRIERLGADGNGAPFSPFYDLNDQDQELVYCSELHRWWAALEEKKKELLGNVVQIGGDGVVPQSVSPRSARPHLLIKDAYAKNDSPNKKSESFGYFNCTVELIHKYENNRANSRYWEIYVTDYTSNEYCYHYKKDSTWCPSGLWSSILRVELWDGAYGLGSTLVKGEYYRFDNMRMIRANSGYYEGKMKEPKISKRSESNSSRDPHFQALLERKAQWQEKNGVERNLSKIEYVKVKDVTMNQRFDCILEVLHTGKPSSPTRSDIYATDYTSNALLSNTSCDAPEAQNLKGRILKIALHDSQAENATQLNPGDICVFLKLRLQNSVGEVVGYLGGDQQLIRRLNSGVPSHKALIEQLRRERNLWSEASRDGAPIPGSSSAAPMSKPTSSSVKPRRPCSTIKEVEASEEHNAKYYIAARVISFKPNQLEDFIYRRCSKCEEEIPATQRACVRCDDIDHEHVQLLFRFAIMIEDEEGSKLPLFTPNDCPLLRDVRRADLRVDRAAYQELRARFQTFAGNVLSYYADRCNGIDTKLESPMMYFEVVKEACSRYWLWNCEPVD